MLHHITVFPQNRNMDIETGQRLLNVLRSASLIPDAPCGGNGTCGKCKVTVDGKEVLACQTLVDRDMTVILPQAQETVILTDGIQTDLSDCAGINLAIDIGTTTVAAYLTENGQVLATESRKNPQAPFGADVVSRLHAARKGQREPLTEAIRNCAEEMSRNLLAKAQKKRFDRVCVVGNPAMQQLFLGIPIENLVTPPFSICSTDLISIAYRSTRPRRVL